MKRILVLGWILVGLLWAEPFVYGGLGSSSKQVKRNKTAIYKLRQETARLREEIEGLRSIIEGLNQAVGRLQQQKGSGSGDKKLLTDIANLIDEINQNYVSKAELSRALKQGKLLVKSDTKRPKITPKPATKSTKKLTKKAQPSHTKTSSRLAKASSSALYSKGVRLVNKKRYTDAKKRFDILAERGYKKASTHFYLGEIAYRTGHYNTAVEEYKQSTEPNDNAGYMDRLLLHAGLSFEKNGDKDQAKRFFQAIVDGYPGTTSASVAKKHLK
jgi:TolA-binding protein